MTVYIGGWDIEYAVLAWSESDEKYMHDLMIGTNAYARLDEYHPLWTEYIGSALYPPRPAQPSQWHTIWDDVNNKWLPNSLFDAALITHMRTYRRNKANNAPAITRTFDEGGPNEEVLGIKPNDDSLLAVMMKGKKPEWNQDAETVMFRFETFTSVDAMDIGNRVVPFGFLQDFYDEMDDVNQSYRDAEEATLRLHLSTPFDDFEAAEAHFDGIITGV